MKRCGTCRRCKPRHAFHARRASNDGLSACCKRCQRAYDKARAGDRRRVQARSVYASTAQGRAAGTRAKRAWARRNKTKRAAQIALGNAVRDGKIIKGPCEVCGTRKRVHGHHDDYSKPLKVRWLCPADHSAHHRRQA